MVVFSYCYCWDEGCLCSLLFRVFVFRVEMHAGKPEGAFNGILALIQTNRQMQKVGNQVGDFTAAAS
jgi:hypothetical protein